jgi:hypothetical protein
MLDRTRRMVPLAATTIVNIRFALMNHRYSSLGWRINQRRKPIESSRSTHTVCVHMCSDREGRGSGGGGVGIGCPAALILIYAITTLPYVAATAPKSAKKASKI